MRRLIVAISGASGVIYGIRTLERLRQIADVESHVIITPSAYRTALAEVDYSPDEIKALADHLYNHKDIGAAISSGSFQTDGMIVAPCSIKTLSAIANCFNAELIARSADVCLKERRRVVLLLRETPFHAGHIRLMDQATQSGAIIMPPVPGLYTRPQTVDDIIDQSVGRALGDAWLRWDGGERLRRGRVAPTDAEQPQPLVALAPSVRRAILAVHQ